MSSRTDDTPVLLYGVIHILIRMCFVVLGCKPTPSLHKVCFVKYRGLSRNQKPLEPQTAQDAPWLRGPSLKYLQLCTLVQYGVRLRG